MKFCFTRKIFLKKNKKIVKEGKITFQESKIFNSPPLQNLCGFDLQMVIVH